MRKKNTGAKCLAEKVVRTPNREIDRAHDFEPQRPSRAKMYIAQDVATATLQQDPYVNYDYDIDSVILCCQVTFGILFAAMAIKCCFSCLNILSLAVGIAMTVLIVNQAHDVVPKFTFVLVHVALLTVVAIINVLTCGIL